VAKEDSTGWSKAEREAMKERARELRQQKGKAKGEADLLEKIAEMPPADRALAERIHRIVSEVAPSLEPRTWYGMPAYAAAGKVIVFFQAASKFESRYSTLGFNDGARLDDGVMWPTAYAITEMTPEAEKAIAALIEKAVS
jgi:uncharacterized protein YdhG (YjbR/CyaY superfamily)